SHREAAAILKAIGCVDALKLDGGGSTAMVVCGEHVNDLTGGNRPVVTTVGFFRK
ncbi:MAG: phosphodiester glycosidase family protein, partial [Alistipes sp.]|nr:phosphodiester glycosidase family protein [Alistipes sp.]